MMCLCACATHLPPEKAPAQVVLIEDCELLREALELSIDSSKYLVVRYANALDALRAFDGGVGRDAWQAPRALQMPLGSSLSGVLGFTVVATGAGLAGASAVTER